MIAVFGLVGGQHFAARYVSTRAEGERWHAAHLARLGETQASLAAHRQSDVLTDAEAKKVRYRDGRCPFGAREGGAWVWSVSGVAEADREADERAAQIAAEEDEIARDALAYRRARAAEGSL